MKITPSPSIPPPGFTESVYERIWTIGFPRSEVWGWLCDPATFVDGQIPPFRVEFLPDADGPGEFREGVYNSHVGPLMCFAGVLGEIREPEYRDLQYCYGSYALSHALFRPTRLEFWVDETGPSTSTLRLRLTTHVRQGRAERLWGFMMSVFWKRFGSWCERDLGRSVQKTKPVVKQPIGGRLDP